MQVACLQLCMDVGSNIVIVRAPEQHGNGSVTLYTMMYMPTHLQDVILNGKITYNATRSAVEYRCAVTSWQWVSSERHVQRYMLQWPGPLSRFRLDIVCSCMSGCSSHLVASGLCHTTLCGSCCLQESAPLPCLWRHHQASASSRVASRRSGWLAGQLAQAAAAAGAVC